MKFKHDALAIIAAALASVLMPPTPIAPSAWAAANLIVPDGEYAGSPIDLLMTPFLKEPLDLLGPDSSVNELAVMKSAQTGFTLMLLALIGHMIDRNPCRAMIIQPTLDALAEFNRDKLDPAIRGTSVLKRKVLRQTSRGAGSNSRSKRYPGGSLNLAIASSPADLRGKTIKIMLRDEIDQYPDDLEGQGDPLELSDARQISFLASHSWKKADISTPTIKGASKIERRYLQGDQRRWNVPCPQCADEFVFEWGDNFRFSRTFPHKAFYVAPCCGRPIENHEKIAIVRAGRWVATASRPGAFPSYHFDTLSSPFVPWDHLASIFVAAADKPLGLKSFWNLWLGLPYEMRGDAPDHVRLMTRREEAPPRGHIPPRGLLLIASADVQMRGIWCEIIAIAPDRQTWVVDAFYCDGSTEAPGSLSEPPDSLDSPGGNAFTKMLHKTIGREFPDAFGRTRKIDALAIDSGYRSHIVYAVVRNNQRLHPDTGQDMIFAVKGDDGWGKPPMSTPSLVDIDLSGHRVKKGCKLWRVGTWPLKGGFYADLRKEGLKAGAEVDPPGYCHFGTWQDEDYFRQLTSEYLAETNSKGRSAKSWEKHNRERDNHFLDCRVYNLAVAEFLGLSSITPAEWAGLAKERGMPLAQIPDLFRPAPTAGAQPAQIVIVKSNEETIDAQIDRLAKMNAENWN